MPYALEDEFGDIIGKARRGLGLSVADAAGQVGVTPGDIEKMEDYTLTPDQATIGRLAALLALEEDRLGAIAREEWEPEPCDYAAGADIAIERFLVEEYNANVYLLLNGKTDTAVLIDAGGLGEAVAERVRQAGVRLLAILNTHGHFDHTEAASTIRRRTGADMYLHAADVSLVKGDVGGELRALPGGDSLALTGFDVRFVPTPGHTAGSVTYVIGSAAFTGDTLFAGSMGGCSLTYSDMLQTIRERILTLPAATKLLPGHGPATTVREERAHNPYFA